MVGHPNDGPAASGSRPPVVRTARPGAIAALLAGYVICRGLVLIGVIPPWQGPDEPGHAEYALLLARGGGSPAAADPGLEAAILASMAEHRFYGRVRAPAPARPPARFTDVVRLRDAPTQLADETPIGYLPFAAALVATGTDRAPAVDVAAALYRMRLAALALVLATAALTWRMASGMLGPRLAPAAVVVLVAAPWMGHAAVVNTDLSAVALAAAWFAALATTGRAPDRRPSRAIVLAVLAVTAALAKRTALFLVPLTVGVVVVWGWVRRRVDSPGKCLAAIVTLAAATIVAAWPIDDRAAGWDRVGESWGAERRADAAHSGRWGLRVVDGSADAWQYLEQWVALPRGGRWLRATAWIRSADPDVPARAQLVVNDDLDTWLGESVVAGRYWTRVTVEGFLADASRRVRVALVPGDATAAGMGAIDVDDLRLVVHVRSPVVFDNPSLLVNPDAETPRSRGAELAAAAARYTDVARLAGAIPGGLRDPGASAARAARGLAFAWRSLWGGYGWLAIWPGPIYRLAAAIMTIFALAAVAAALWRPGMIAPDPAMSGVVRTCAAAIVIATVFAVAGAQAGAGPDRLPQGRYLLPALVPLAPLMVGLADRWSPRRGAALVAAAVIVLDLWSALGVIWPGFRGP